jgi:Na+/H+ antiporter NhaD/arsenite permease-like protein
MPAAIVIFALTYLVLALGRLPGFRVDRTGAAVVGASLMLAFNVLTVEEANAAIDYDTIMLLFGMMIVVANLRLSGFFTLVSAWVVKHAHRPLLLLCAWCSRPWCSKSPCTSNATRLPICSRSPWRPTSAVWPPSRAIRRT